MELIYQDSTILAPFEGNVKHYNGFQLFVNYRQHLPTLIAIARLTPSHLLSVSYIQKKYELMFGPIDSSHNVSSF